MVIVGIDPGKTGAIATLWQGEDLIYPLRLNLSASPELSVMKDIHWVADYLESIKQRANGEVKVYIERAQAMPKNGSVGMFRYGQHFGELLGILVALRIPFETVHPSVWTLAIHQTRKSALTPKARSLQAVQRLFPGVSLTDPESTRAKKPHQGIVDALLIAEWGRRQWMKA